MVRLADAIDWNNFEQTFGVMWKDKGRPAIDTRLMVSLHYLKYTYDLSDEDVVESWLESSPNARLRPTPSVGRARLAMMKKAAKQEV